MLFQKSCKKVFQSMKKFYINSTFIKKTRSSERTKIAYFPGGFVVVENLIVRTEGKRGCGQTDKKYKERSDVIPFKQKKNFRNLTIRTEIKRRVRNGK